MAEATALRNNALPYPVYGAPYTIVFPVLDNDGDLVTAAAALDSEVSKNGDTFADCTNEATEIATSSGVYYLSLTGTEMTTDIASVIVKTTTADAKTTPVVLYPRKLVTLRTGTSQGGAAGYITLDASAGTVNDMWNGCLCVAVIDSNTEARIITDYDGSNQQASVTPGWNVAPDADDTFTIYLPEGMQLPTSFVSDGTAAGQLNITSGVVDANAAQVSGDSAAADALELLVENCKGADHKVLVSSDAQDLSATLDVNAKTLGNDCITSAKYDESSAFPVKSEDAGATQIARVGADADTLETLSDQIDLQATLAICTETRMAELDAANLPADVDAILADTGTDGVVLANDAITSAKYDESTAFPVKSADTGATQIARTGADADTLETLSDEIAAVSGGMGTEANQVLMLEDLEDIKGTGFVKDTNSLVDILGSLGSGADSVTITVLEDDAVTPVADVDVWITTDEAGAAIVAGTSQTDSSGQVTFMLDGGSTYWLWRQKDGVTFDTVPEEFDAVAD